MKGSTWRALALVGVAALVFVSVAVAANSRSFSDASGDSVNSPDLTAVTISNDDAGIVTVKLTLGNRPSLGPGDGVAIGLDTDQNPDTGSVFYGAEWELDPSLMATVHTVASLYRGLEPGPTFTQRLDQQLDIPGAVAPARSRPRRATPREAGMRRP
jgi:hypothetical protein